MLKHLHKSFVVSILSVALMLINMPLMAQVDPTPLSEEHALILKNADAERAAIRAALGLSSEFTKTGVMPPNIPELKEERSLWNELKAKAKAGDSEAKQKVAGVDKIVKDLNAPKDNRVSVDLNSKKNTNAAGFTRQKDGVLTKTETHSFTGNKDADDNLIHSLTMLAVGFVGMKLLFYKKWTPDMTTAAVASGLYITSEVMNIVNMKKQLRDVTAETTKRNDGKMDQAQIEALEKLKASYEAAKSAVKMRKNFQMAAAAAYLVATGIATVKSFTEAGQMGSCLAGIASGNAALVTCSAVVVNPDKTCPICQAKVNALLGLLNSYTAGAEAPGPSTAKFALTNPIALGIKTNLSTPCGGPTSQVIFSSFIAPACGAYLLSSMIGQAHSPSPIVDSSNVVSIEFDKFNLNKKIFNSTNIPARLSYDPNIKIRNVFQNLINLIIPKAEAGSLAMLGLSAGALTAFAAIKFEFSQTIDMIMFTPRARIVVWGMFAAATKTSADASQKELDRIEDNIKKIDQILAELNVLQKGIAAASPGSVSYSVPYDINTGGNADSPTSPDKKPKPDCLTPGCAPVPDNFKEIPGFAELPDSFKSMASQVSSLGNGLNGNSTLSGATLSGAANLGNNLNAIGKTVAALKSKLNDSLAKNGKPKIDFDKEEKKVWGNLKTGVAKSLSDRGTSASALFSGMGLSPISSANASTAPVAAIAPKKPVSVGGGSVGGGAPAKAGQFEFKEATGEAAGAGENGAGLAAKNDELDLGSNDINTNSGESIFQLISNRYIKSGYPKLLEEIPVKK